MTPLSIRERDASQRPTIWFEVDDFIRYFDRVPNPSGIQRVQMEIFAAAHAQQAAGCRVRFCRLNRLSHRFEVVDFNSVAAVFEHPPLALARPDLASDRAWPIAWFLNKREEFRRARRKSFVRVRGQLRRLIGKYSSLDRAGALLVPFKFGDILLCAGAGWENPCYGEFVSGVRQERGVRFGVIVYDLIPLTHPQWVDRGHCEAFRDWLVGVLTNADIVLTISKYSRSVLTNYAEKEGMIVPHTEILPLGAGFRALLGRSIGATAITNLPPEFVLFVSTLEPRKNHRLLVRAWNRLIEKHGARDVPSLVFVGRLGWMIDDLMAELERSEFLAGKITRLSDLCDTDLREVYRRCLVSVFPSFVEGWGLPVAESLEEGKLCIASSRASIPEVGGDLVDYVDPDDEVGMVAALERAIFDDAYRSAREARIRAEYRPTSWAGCVEVLLWHLHHLSRDSSDMYDVIGASAPEFLNLEGTSQ
jgi:glycosyltransferase involved in cell wall biosynthesis